jgi:hypothetical protein
MERSVSVETHDDYPVPWKGHPSNGKKDYCDWQDYQVTSKERINYSMIIKLNTQRKSYDREKEPFERNYPITNL